LIRRHGFTILEILIALVVLGISLLGVLALLVGTTKVAGEVVEDRLAATLARSVHDAMRIAARERSFAVVEGDRVRRGFVLAERGMSNVVPTPGAASPAEAPTFTPPPLPAGPADTGALAAMRASDFTIFLPSRPTTGEPSTFVFPRPRGAAIGNADGGDDDRHATPVSNARGVPITYRIARVYPMSHVAAPPLTGDDARPVDALDAYSFAIIVRLAGSVRVDYPPQPPPGDESVWPGKAFQPDEPEVADGLYQVEVQVFRGFDPDPEQAAHLPRGRFGALLAVGP
jgi:prepilin-type N-terminal cleavage/methylation domain-containing protein